MFKSTLRLILPHLIKRKKSISKREFFLIANLLKYLPVPHTMRGKVDSARWGDKEVAEIKKEVQEGRSMSFKYANRFLSELHPNCKEKLLKNFFFGMAEKYNKKWKKTQEEGSFTPATILISPLMRCNLSCVGCYAKYYSKKDDMPDELFERIIREGEEMGVLFYSLVGGEPTLVFDKIYRIFKKYNTAYAQMFTNSTLINDKMAEQLQELGNIFVVHSVEGFEKETDERRGKGVFQKVMGAMEILKKHGVPHGFSATVTRKNADIVLSDEFIDLMIEKGALWGWYFLYMPVGGDTDISLMPTPEQRAELWKRHLEIRSRKPIEVIDFWGDATLTGGCIAGRFYVHINNYGMIEPCVFTHFTNVDIKDKSLKEAMASPLFKEYRSRQPFSKNLLLPCPLIDHPEVFREIRQKYNLRPTHPKAETLTGVLAPMLDQYSAEVRQKFDRIWKENYQSRFKES